ncbi:MAG: hypothetical protein Q7R49_05240 [Candidatus Daviesbacteria bacterium]|nr:hypothetical protein [Candidatus Daviesbacteria bacterium]
MFSTGSEIRWKEGNILLPALKWQSPSKRRIPRLLVEHRAMEVGILIFIEGSSIVFKETGMSADQIKLSGGQREAKEYQTSYHLIPQEIEGEDSFVWLSKPGNKLILFNRNGKYFIKSA